LESLSIAEAKSRFSEVVSRAVGGERFLIERRHRPVAVVLGPEEYERLERSAASARRLAATLGQSDELLLEIEAGEVHPAMAAFGLWREEEDLEDLPAEIRRTRRRRSRRPPVNL
jgi:prevent-host-death family protein